MPGFPLHTKNWSWEYPPFKPGSSCLTPECPMVGVDRKDEKKLHFSLRVPIHPTIASLPQIKQVRGRKFLQLVSIGVSSSIVNTLGATLGIREMPL